MKKIIVILVLIFATSSSHACLNIYYSLDNSGNFNNDAEYLRRAFNTNFNAKRLEKSLKKVEEQLKTNNDYKLLSDYSVLLLKAGKTERALDLLEQLSIQHPDDYQIAANLGTAYELVGNNEKALEYIKRGIELNPEAHDGSEWVHVNILEAKLKLAKDGSYLNNHSVLDLTAAQKNDENVRNQLMIQIRERFPFCKGPDPIMASLLIDLGDCHAITSSIEFAKASYEIAKHYYGAEAEVIDPKIDEAKQLLRQYSKLRVDSRALRQEGDQGTHLRMSQINYKDLLDDNNPSEYEIDWSTLQSNPDSLLSYAGITRFTPPVEVVETEKPIQEAPKQEEPKEKSTAWIYFLIAGLLLGGGAIFLARRKKN